MPHVYEWMYKHLIGKRKFLLLRAAPFRAFRDLPQSAERTDSYQQYDNADERDSGSNIISIANSHHIDASADQQVAQIIADIVEQHEDACQFAGRFGIQWKPHAENGRPAGPCNQTKQCTPD